jgi:hypothetical protein
VPFRVALIGPSGDSIAVTANGILRDLPGGTYQVRPSDPDVTPDDIASPADTAILVAGGTTAYIMLRYRFLTGGANISAFGLPDGDTARLHVRAPDSTLMTLRIPGLNRGLQVGVWRILEEPHRKNGDVYEFPPAGTFPVEAGPQATSFTLTYSLQSAKLNVRFRGYPPGLPKRATLIHGFYPDTFRILGDTMLTGVRANLGLPARRLRRHRTVSVCLVHEHRSGAPGLHHTARCGCELRQGEWCAADQSQRPAVGRSASRPLDRLG